MNLTGRQIQQLRDLVVDSFTLRAFDDMIKFRLDKKRENIALGEDFKEIATRVIEEADEEGWLPDLIQALEEERAQVAGFQAKLKGITAAAERTRFSERIGDFLQNRRLGRYGILLGLLLALGAGGFGVWYLLDSNRRKQEAEFLNQTKAVEEISLDELEGWINYGRELTARSKPPPQILLQTRTQSLSRRLWLEVARQFLELIAAIGPEGLLERLRHLLETAPDLPDDAQVVALKNDLKTELQKPHTRWLPNDGEQEDDRRPTLRLCGDRLARVPATWPRLSEERVGDAIASASRNTGALKINGRIVASAFRVTETVVLTVSFALEGVASQTAPGVWSILPKNKIEVDFGSDACDSPERSLPVTAVRYVSGPGVLHVAVLEIPASGIPFQPLALTDEVPGDRKPVFVVGFSSGVKSLMPGFLLDPSSRSREAVIARGSRQYDARTSGASTGGPLVDLGTGRVIGIHWGGGPGRDGEKIGFANPISKILGVPNAGLRDLVGR